MRSEIYSNSEVYQVQFSSRRSSDAGAVGVGCSRPGWHSIHQKTSPGDQCTCTITTTVRNATPPNAQPQVPIAEDDSIQRRLWKAKLHAKQREQLEISIFMRIHIPESNPVSFRQVATVVCLLLSWARPTFPHSAQRKRPNIYMTDEERTILLRISNETQTTYSSYLKESQFEEGGSATISRATRKGKNNLYKRIVAIKKIKTSHQPRMELIVQEAVIMRQLRHPNVVAYIGKWLIARSKSFPFKNMIQLRLISLRNILSPVSGIF